MAPGESAQEIVDVVDNAKSIGSKVWMDGLDRVQTMHESVRPERIAALLIHAVRGFYKSWRKTGFMGKT